MNSHNVPVLFSSTAVHHADCITSKYFSKIQPSIIGLLAASVLMLTACSSTPTNNKRPSYANAPNYYVVRSGDTVSKIAMRYGLDYRRIGALNGLDSNYTIYKGQRLILVPARQARVTTVTRPVPRPSQSYPTNTYTSPTPSYSTPRYPVAPAPINVPMSASGSQQTWLRPVNGNLIRPFNQAAGVMGNWYSGSQGMPVVASQAGTVLYTGSDLPEYGKLVLIQHSSDYISAYAQLDRINVQEKQTIAAGQTIGTMGYVTSLNQPAVEFQIRYRGTPVNPANFLR